MHEDAFLQIILTNPSDDTNLLVYADWLDEAGDDLSLKKAEYLRLTAVTLPQTDRRQWRATRTARLQQLSAILDTNWLAVVSHLTVENCRRDRTPPNAPNPRREYTTTNNPSPRKLLSNIFQFVCTRKWEGLVTTHEGGIRFCDDCKKNVYYCDTITAAREHAHAGHCIALDLGVIRHEGDLLGVRTMSHGGKVIAGEPNAEELEAQLQFPPLDVVSAAREQAK